MGRNEFIPHWLGIENDEKKPYAEYWMGAHPSAPSTLIINNDEKNLNELIKNELQNLLVKKQKKIW